MLALRTIAVSTRSALRHRAGEHRGAVVDQADSLLAELEAAIMRDGGDQFVLDAIERERRVIQSVRANA